MKSLHLQAAIDCVAGDYETLSCLGTCGGAIGQQRRVIDVEAQHNGKDCTFDELSTKTFVCNADPCPINCVTAWSQWSSCSHSCGRGLFAALCDQSVLTAVKRTADKNTDGQHPTAVWRGTVLQSRC
jgi:hypothetical protein